MSDEGQKPPDKQTLAFARDRRGAVRHEFNAMAKMIDPKSGAPVEMRVRDLALGGCRVETANPFPVGQLTKIRITKETQSFEAVAKVVSVQAGKSMGLLFSGIESEQRRILETWLAQTVGSQENAWRESNRRRSQRILLRVPVIVSGYDANKIRFKEKTFTDSISANGALVLLAAPVTKGLRLALSKDPEGTALDCVVVYVGRRQGAEVEIGVKFAQPNPVFWGVSFPPIDDSTHRP
ncbi:MAG: PilZ domain-containing protein [Candidatus Acidiferrales bacterium]